MAEAVGFTAGSDLGEGLGHAMQAKSLPWIAKGGTLNRPAEALVAVPKPGRDYPVTVGGIIS